MNDTELRELNLAMAQVCGYRVVDRIQLYTPFIYAWPGPGGLDLYKDDTVVDWSPATNPAQAPEALEALRKKGWIVTIRAYPDDLPIAPDDARAIKGDYVCRIERPRRDNDLSVDAGHVAWGALPEAICKAVLAATKEASRD